MSSDSWDTNSGFHFYWDIENIDMCFIEERITSPMFVATNLNQTEWCISLQPLIPENTFMLTLIRMDTGKDSESISIDFELSVSISDGTQRVLKKEKRADFKTGSSSTCYWIYGSSEILFQEYFTVYCHMKQSVKETLPHIRCWARTVVGKEQRYGVWKVQNFRNLSPGYSRKYTLLSTVKLSPQIEISGSLSKKSSFFYIKLLVTHDRPFFMFGKISLVTEKGDLKWPTIQNFFFNNYSASRETYKFPLVLKKGILAPEFLNSGPSYLLPEGSLTLLCEFNISTGMKYSEIIESSYLTQKYRALTHREITRTKSEWLSLKAEDSATHETQPISVNSDTNSSTPQTLKENLKKLYEQKKHCDVILHCENKTFPAHRSILCSRSSVFNSMFDHDTTESTNKKDIVDMDADTLDSFLLFLYSEILDNLQWNRATKLMYAANRYQVASLKNECSSFIMSNLSLSNTCEALELADLYQDDKLRTSCQDFILENAAEMFSSKEWEKFTVGNPILSAKMLQRYFSTKE